MDPGRLSLFHLTPNDTPTTTPSPPTGGSGIKEERFGSVGSINKRVVPSN